MKKGNGLYIRNTVFLGIMAAAVIMTGCGKNSDKKEAASDDEKAVVQDTAESTKEETSETEEKESEEENQAEAETVERELTQIADDENCRIKPSGIISNGKNMIVTDTYYKAVWEYDGSMYTRIAGGDSVLDIYDAPVGGYNDGNVDEALFSDIFDLTEFVDGYVVSDPNNDVLRFIHDGMVETVNPSIKENGKEKLCVMKSPTGVTTDENGNLFVSNTGEGEIIRISSEGKAEKILKNLDEPTGICVSDGYLYFVETGANKISRISIKEKKTGIPEIVAGSGEAGFEDGKVNDAKFRSPKGITVAEDGTVYVADTVNAAVRCIKDGEVTTLIEGNTGELDAYPVSPVGLCLKGDTLYVCDNFDGKIYQINIE